MRTAALALALWSGSLAAQGSAVAYGVVRDGAGQPIPDARVAVGDRPIQARTDARGAYRLPVVPPGAVVVRASAIGYAPARRTVVLAAGDSVAVDFVLTATRVDRRADVFHLPEVVVTAAKRSQLVEQAVTSVVVVTEDQIARRAVNTVDEALDRAAGVQLLNGQINIRGSTGYVLGLGARVLLLVDGVPMNQGDRGGINWDLVPVDEVERVEVVKGAGSALYGSAALGGVVNLITRDVPHGLHARVRTTAGVYANPPHDIWAFRDHTGLQGGVDAGASYGTGSVRGGFTAGTRRSEGYREQDERDHRHVAARAIWDPSDAAHVRISGSWAVDDHDVPLSWCTRGYCDDRDQDYQPFRIDTRERGARTTSRKGYLTAALTQLVSDRHRVDARVSWLHTRFDDERPSAVDYSTANRMGGEVRAEIHGATGVVTTIGVEGARSHVMSDVFGGLHTQGEYGAYGAGEASMGPVRTTTGVRIDYLTVDGGALRAVVSPRVGAVLQAVGGAWRASAGRGFRAPSIGERFPEAEAFGLRTVPNPTLDPETAWSVELGHQRVVGRWARLDAAVFWTEASQLIEPTVTDSGVIQFRNVSHARMIGLDLVFEATLLPGLTTSVAYQYLSARERATDSAPERPLAFRPAHLATVSVDYALAGSVTVGAEFRHMSRLERVDLFPDDPRVAMSVLDLRATYRRGPLRVALLLANAFNYIYNLTPRTLAPVRTVTATLTWTR